MEPSRSNKTPGSSERRDQVGPKLPIRKCEACRISKRKCEPAQRDWSKGEKCFRCRDRGEDCSEPAIAIRKRRRRSKTVRRSPTSPLSRRASDVNTSLAIPFTAARTPIPCNQLLSPRTRSRTSIANSFFEGNETLQPLTRLEENRLPLKSGDVVITSSSQCLDCPDASAKTTNHSAEIYLTLQCSRSASDTLGAKGQLECDVENTRDHIDYMSSGLEKRLFDIQTDIFREYSANESSEQFVKSQDEMMNSISRTSHLFELFDPSVFKFDSLEEQQAIFLRKEIEKCCAYGLYGWVCMLLRKLCSLPNSQMTEQEHALLADSYTKTSSLMKPFLLGNSIYPNEKRISPSSEPFPALHRAILDGQTEVVKALISKPNYAIDQPDILKRQPIHIAAMCSSLEILKYIVNKCRRDELNCRDLFLRTPLAYIARSGNLVNFSFLHNAGARLDARDKFGHSILATAAGSGQIEIVKYALDAPNGKVDPSDNGIGAMGALHKAAENGHTDVAELLLERGARDRPLKTGQTAHDIARERNSQAIARAIELSNVIQFSSDVGSTRTPIVNDTSSWEPSMPSSVDSSDPSNTYETGTVNQSFNQSIMNPSIAATGHYPSQLLARNPQGYPTSWTNYQLDRQQFPSYDGNSASPPNPGYAQMPFNASLSQQTSLSGQHLSSTVTPIPESIASTNYDTRPKQWYPPPGVGSYRPNRFPPSNWQPQ